MGCFRESPNSELYEGFDHLIEERVIRIRRQALGEQDPREKSCSLYNCLLYHLLFFIPTAPTTLKDDAAASFRPSILRAKLHCFV